jgi:DNA-binding transcriptional ArsR family regulator
MVARDITIDGDPEEVWEALCDPDLLAEWLGDDGLALVEEAEPSERLVLWLCEEDEPGSRVELRLVAGGHARHGDRGAGRPVRARGRVSPEPDVFAALADPTRRTVLEEVASRGSATATELAAPLGITRQAVAKHLGVLADAGLVDARRAGRETRYRPTPAPMGEAISWMAEVGARWDERLAALERSVVRRRGRGGSA